MPQPIRERRSLAESNWFRLAGIAWLAAYFAAFFSQDLPNSNPRVNRSAVAREAPWLLLDLVDPPRLRADDPQAIMIRARSGWRFLPQRLDLLLVAGAIIGAAWSSGHLVLRVLRTPLPNRCLEQDVFAVGLGLSLLSLVTLGCGLAGWLSRPLLGGGLLAIVASEVWLRVRARFVSPRPQGERDAGWWWLVASSPFLLCILLGAMLPSTDFDANEYHLQGPKEFFQSGHITFLQHNVYTSFPLGTEMLTLLAMVLRGDWYHGALAGKTVLACFGPLTALAIFAAGRRWFGSVAGGVAAFVFVSTPWVYRIATIAGAEGGLCCYLFLALFATILAADSLRMENGGSRRRLWLLAGLFAGSAMACKYPGVLSVVIPVAMVAAFACRPGATAIRSLMCLAVGTVITVGPWLVKNAIETGNPVYPLMYRVFGGRDWDDDLHTKWQRGHSPDNFSPIDLAEKFVDVTVRSDWLSPLLFGLAPLALVFGATRRRAGWLWAYVAYLFLTWWLFTHRIDRFWVPLIPVVSLLAGMGGAWLMESPLAPARGDGPGVRGERLATVILSLRPQAWLVAVVVGAVSLFNLAFITTPLCNFNAFLLDLDLARKLAVQVTAPEIAYLNEHLPPGSRVLCVGEAQVFDAEFPLIYNTVFDRSLFEAWCGASGHGGPAASRPLRDPAAIRQTLQAAGVTHVLVNWSEVLRYRTTYGYTGFVSPDRFNSLREAGVIGPAWEIPVAFRELSTLDKTWQAEIDRWGRGLVTTVGERAVIPAFQVFPIAQEE